MTPVISRIVDINGADIIDGSTSNLLNNVGINAPIIAPTIILINKDNYTIKTTLFSFINIKEAIAIIKLHNIPVISPTAPSFKTFL